MAAENYSSIIDSTQEGEVRKLPLGDMYVDLGVTGLKRSAGVIDEEFLPALRGAKSVQVYREMSLNEPVVGSLLYTIEMLLRQVEWTVVGADQSPEQTEAVQFVEECMDDMSHSWGDTIAEILSALTYGWCWNEIVYKKRIGPWETDPKKRSKFTDGKTGWRKLPIRAQETLVRWIFDDDGGVKGMVQMAPPKYEQKSLPIERSLLFRTGVHKGNPEGLSILRRAYRPWYFKKRLEEFEAIGVERDLAGLPVAKLPAEYMEQGPNADPKKKAMFNAFKKLVSNVRRDEHEGIVIPSDVDPESKVPLFDFELMASGGSRTFDTNALIQRYELAILSTVCADWLKLGHEGGQGSYAMHVDKTGIFRAALNTLAESIADVFNRYAIPRLFEMNQWKLDQLPQIKPSNVDPPNLAELGQFMTSMAGLGMTFFPNADLEKFLLKTAHLPELPEDVEEAHRMMAEQQTAMEFMDQKLQATGLDQQSQMVDQGMTPDQAMMASQTPTPEMAAADPANQQAQMKGEQDAAASQQKMQMDAQSHQMTMDQQKQAHELQMRQSKESADTQAKQGKLDLDQKSKEGDLALKQQVAQMQLELKQMEAKLGMEAKGAEQKLNTQRQADVYSLDAKRKQAEQAAKLKPKPDAKKTAVKKSDNPFRRHR